jgi:TatD DNase family protein
MLIETDSPYLSPDPFRGKSNEPANVKIVAEAVASIKQISFNDVASFTTANFKKIFFNEKN